MLIPSGELLAITIGYIASVVVGWGLGFFVLLQKNRKMSNVAFFLMTTCLAGFQISFILGINTPPSLLAYRFWFANIIDVFLAIFWLHLVVAAFDADKRWVGVLKAAYAIGIVIFVSAFVFPLSFLPRVVPKMYFHSYLDGGPLYIVMLAYFLTVFALCFLIMLVEQHRRGEEQGRRISYFIFALIYGFFTGITAFPLVFSIKIDPILSMLIGTFTIPMVYGMIKKDVLDIKIVFKRTLFFTIVIAGTAGIFVSISLLSQFLAPIIPGFFFVVPLAAALAAVGVGALYWQKANEAEKLKYEFLTVVAHKFRTPLTRIRWSVEALLANKNLGEEERTLIKHVSESDLELIQLANLLMDATEGRSASGYAPTAVSLAPLVSAVLSHFESAIKDKSIRLETNVDPALPQVLGDADRFSSVLSVLMENAVAYTPKDGTIKVSLTGTEEEVHFEIADSGIGVSPEEQRHIFKKFFRTDRARTADTEGVGIGLSMAKAIIERARGSIGVRSQGANQGSTFWFTLPAKKS